jgi:hypothetical protein
MLPDKELRNFYRSPSVVTIAKSGGIKWVGHVVGMLKEKVNLSLCLINSSHAMKIIGEWRCNSTILDLGASCSVT